MMVGVKNYSEFEWDKKNIDKIPFVLENCCKKRFYQNHLTVRSDGIKLI